MLLDRPAELVADHPSLRVTIGQRIVSRFAGRLKVQAHLTGIASPGAEECALEHLRDLERAWAGQA